jgi:uncharacterized protein (TIGR03435 family)
VQVSRLHTGAANLAKIPELTIARAPRLILMRATLGFLVACSAFGQSFEVASVKVSTATPMGERVRPDAISYTPGSVTMTGVTLKAAVQWAYHLQSIQINGPSWIDTGRYDIVAKSPAAATSEQLRLMVRTLLTDRFKLAFHRETKEMPAYVVTIAKGGHKMTPSEGDGEMQVKPTGKGVTVAFTHVTLSQLTEMASSPLEGVVIDQTGLKGAWDFTLDPSSFIMNPPTDKNDAINLIVQVLSDQVGIKVEQKKAAAELLVVDHAEKVPVEN